MTQEDADFLVDEVKKARDGLREYEKLKYAGNCKCGQCNLVPVGFITDTKRLMAALAIVMKAELYPSKAQSHKPNEGQRDE